MNFGLGKTDAKSKMGKLQSMMSPKASATLSTLALPDTDTYETLQARKSFKQQGSGGRVPLLRSSEMDDMIDQSESETLQKLAETLPQLSIFQV